MMGFDESATSDGPRAEEPEIGEGQYDVGDEDLDAEKAEPQVQPDMPRRDENSLEDPDIASGHRDG